MNLSIILTIISFAATAAHFKYTGNWGLAFFFISLPLLLLYRRRWTIQAVSVLLFLSGINWIVITTKLVKYRLYIEEPWIRAAIILSSVTLVIFFTAYRMISLSNSSHISINYYRRSYPAWAFFLTMIITAVAKMKAPFEILIFDRFIPGSGWIEILIISFYAAWVTERFMINRNSSGLRIKIWTIFSVIFFLQLFLGVIGFDKFLMTGELHLPLPALIAGGPIYRGEGFFMPILLTSTIILAGPAWCSHICYIGVWDNIAASKKKKVKTQWRWNHLLRTIIFATFTITALGYNIFNISPAIALSSAIIFAIISFSLIAIISLKRGEMFHCTTICPISVITNLAGKISPFRIRINSNCTECMRCSLVCRYNALTKKNIINRKPGLTCSLCGDCIEVCKYHSISYKFLKLSTEHSKALFIVIIVSLHSATMILARI